MSVFNTVWKKLKKTGDIYNSMDTASAEEAIRGNISFKGPNVWILAFAIIIASVGLNINSTAVIIGAMLISPLMGPIFGLGLGLGTNNTAMLKYSAKNLLVMVGVSLFASALYFLLSPLNLVNPTELEARTNPTIYDLLIALFGGAAGIFEMCRKQKGTVLSGVAIATALMPPICTAGYGLANGNIHFFFGALYLFTINTIFITLSTYLMVKYLKFPEAVYLSEAKTKRTRRIISAIVLIVTVPSIISAVDVIRANNFTQKAMGFVARNKTLEHSYIYDYSIDDRSHALTIYMGGESLKPNERQRLLEDAEASGLKPDKITVKERSVSENAAFAGSEKLLQDIYARADSEIEKREERISVLEKRLAEFSKTEIPYSQISRELKSQYPEISGLYLSRGAKVQTDSTMAEQSCLLVVAQTGKRMEEKERSRLESWLRIRLEDTTVVVMNNVIHP